MRWLGAALELDCLGSDPISPFISCVTLLKVFSFSMLQALQ